MRLPDENPYRVPRERDPEAVATYGLNFRRAFTGLHLLELDLWDIERVVPTFLQRVVQGGAGLTLEGIGPRVRFVPASSAGWAHFPERNEFRIAVTPALAQELIRVWGYAHEHALGTTLELAELPGVLAQVVG